MTKRLLAIFAHPDDESFGPGGTLAKYAAEGVQVAVIIATRGEGSTLGADLHGDKLGQVRAAELECASGALGITDVTVWSYPDTQLDQVDGQELADKVARAISEFRPDALMTFAPGGITGNPDHIVITEAVVLALSSTTTNIDGGHRPTLYFWSILDSVAEHLRSISPIPFVGVPEEEISVIIDTSSYMDQQWEAIHCHKSQSDPLPRVLKDRMEFQLGREFFIQHGHGPLQGPPTDNLFFQQEVTND